MKEVKLPLNCFIGAIMLMIWLRTFQLRVVTRGKHKGHFYVVKNGQKWHFKRLENFLPPGYNHLVFIGKFTKMEKRHAQV